MRLDRAALRARFGAALVCLLGAAACRGEAAVDLGALVATEAVVVAPVGEAPAALYVSLVNGGAAPDTLVAVESPAASRLELHRSMSHGAMMEMAPLDHIEIPAHGELRMVPGGVHVMMTALRRAIEPGDSIETTLVLRRAGRLRIAAKVVSYDQLEVGEPAAGERR